MSDFESNLRAQLEAKPKLKAHEAKVLALLNAPASKRKTKRLARMENHARAAIGADPTAAGIDWSKINWAKALENIMAILKVLLPMLLAL